MSCLQSKQDQEPETERQLLDRMMYRYTCRRYVKFVVIFITLYFVVYFFQNNPYMQRLKKEPGKSNKNLMMKVNSNRAARKKKVQAPWTIAPMDNVNGRVSKILLVTHWRGGSTFLGKIFDENPDAFYWFEPLISPVHQWLRKENIIDDVYLKDGDSYRQLDRPKQELISSLIDKIFNCEFEELIGTGVLSHPFVTNMNFSKSFMAYSRCMRRNLVSKKSIHEQVEKCIPVLKEVCLRSKVRVVKVIRMNMHMAKRLLMFKDPSIKIVYYVRDPRGILNSRTHVQTIAAGNYDIKENVKELCYHMREDMIIYQKMRKTLQGSVMQVHYENLAQQPSKVAARIYGFAEKSVHKNVTTWITENTKAKDDDGAYGTLRKDSAKTATAWRNTMDSVLRNLTERECEEVIKYLS